jgi:hypothetical protein
VKEPIQASGIYDCILCEFGPMSALLQRFYRWFHSFDEDEEPPKVVVKTPEDGARIGMVGWY